MSINYKNFTLLELLATFMIIAILVGITIEVSESVNDKAKNSRTESLVQQVSAAMQSYKVENGFFFLNTANLPVLPTDAPSDIDYTTYKDNFFRFNLGGVVDTEFVKEFDYESLKNRGYIKQASGTNDSYFVDAWDRPLFYKCPGSVNTELFDIGSLGKDGKYGDNSTDSSKFGEGDDITNFNF